MRSDDLNGTNGDDNITGTGSGDLIDGLDGHDTIFGMAGGDVVGGGGGGDMLHGADELNELASDGDNIVKGGVGDDAVWGGPGADQLSGGAGADVITEGPENDAYRDDVYGGDGDDIDVVSVPASRDVVDCGPGVDYVEADSLDEISANCEKVSRVTLGDFQAAGSGNKCEVYRDYNSWIAGKVYLRWGESTFGYRHIKQKHGFQSRRIAYVLQYGSVVRRESPTRVVQQDKCPGDRRSYRVVLDTNHNSERCPGMQLGIITAFHYG